MGLELFSPDQDRLPWSPRRGCRTGWTRPSWRASSETGTASRSPAARVSSRARSSGSATSAGIDEFDIATALSAVELVLGELGAPIERGVAATRALEVYAEGATV